MSEEWRELPATELQKGKLRFFGATWTGDITRGGASDAIQAWMDAYPDKEDEWQDLHPSPEQIQRLQELGEPIDPQLTYGEAIKQISDCEEELNCRIDHYHDGVNFEWADDYREATREEVAQAIAYLDNSKPGWKYGTDVFDALQTLFPDYQPKPTRPGFLTSHCGCCRGAIEVELPKYDREVTPDDIVFSRVKCPHCGEETTACTLRPQGG